MGLNSQNRLIRLFRFIGSGRVQFRPFPLVIKLTARESVRLLNDLESPPPPNDELKKALALYKQAIG
jgi:hypothetical protein